MDRNRTLPLAIGMTLALVLAAGPARAADDKDGADFFERKVRPVLATHCVSCHGPDKQKAGLRLDSAEGLKKGGDSGPVVTPGKPEESRLVEAVTYHASDLQMPPKGKLPDGDIAALSRWVKAGAAWPEATKEPRPAASIPAEASRTITAEDRAFWSFRPVRKVEPPAVGDGDWARTPIDRFVYAAMSVKGFVPTPRADKRTLLRRVAFDLTGLPPTPAEVDSFLKDDRPDAFAKVVDRLLASPAYGERWARHWLDLVRYGEDQAHTFQARVFPQGYLYRDWVVKSLNVDLPYDRFLKEQVAADLIDGPDKDDRLAALGLFGLGASYYSGSPAAVADEWDDKLDTMARSMLGLTVACARCHDHKFDPIPTADYYSLAGVIAGTVYKEYPRAPADVVARSDKAEAAVKAKTAEVATFLKSAGEKLPERLAGRETANYLVGAWSLANKRKADPKLTTAAFAKAEGLRADSLDRWSAYLLDREALKKGRPHLARWRALIEGEDPKVDLSGRPEAKDKARAVGQALQDYLKATLALRDALKAHKAAESANLGDAAPPPQVAGLRDLDAKALGEIASADGPFSIGRGMGSRLEALLDDGEKVALKAKKDELDGLKKAVPPKYPVVHGVADAPNPQNIKIYLRGNPTTPGPEVPRRFLAVLSPGTPGPFGGGSGRLGLAEAIASRDNPLTARVIVNRVWAQHFGRGIVATPSNFGATGERPSHPELLDWLAARLVESGWSLKALHREILLTAAYAQGSDPGPKSKALESDPENAWLSHASRRRLEVEAWRDAMLAVTGELDPAVGGASVDLASTANRRRTLYAKVSRHKLDGLLRQFDFPDPNLSSDKRSISTVPLQGLFVLNSDFMARRAEALASRLAADPKEADAARIGRAFGLLYGRPPDDDEVALGLDFLKAADPAKGEPSAWAQYAQVLLGSNEFLFVD